MSLLSGRRWLGAAVVVLILLVAGVIGYAEIRHDRIEREYERELRINQTLNELSGDVFKHLPREVADDVYSCKARYFLTPCPDYIATVVFTPQGPRVPPAVESAFRADGTPAISLRASNFATDSCPPDMTCNDVWSAQVTVAEGVRVFASVSTFHGEWMGPRWASPTAYESGITTYFLEPEGYTVKLLAVDTKVAVAGQPLADELLGH